MSDFDNIWLACMGSWAVAGGYSPTVGFSVALLSAVGGEWIFVDKPSDGTCMLAFKATQTCNYIPGPLPLPYATFKSLVLRAGLQIVESGTTVITPAGWTPP
jgi:hypothetical protein